MRLLGSRRAGLVACVATAAARALTGCSAGQIAETAIKKPSVPGTNADNSDGSVAVRNLTMFYNNPEGYEAGGTAPIEVALINQTRAEIIVTVTSTPAEGGDESVVSGRMVGIVGGDGAPAGPPSEVPSDSPSGAPSEPATPAAQPARITLAPHAASTYLPGDDEQLVVMGLTDALRPGQSVNLTFEFSNGAEPLTLRAPVSTPLSPAPREEGSAEEHD